MQNTQTAPAGAEGTTTPATSSDEVPESSTELSDMDGWAEAEEAFNDPEGAEEPQQKAEAKPEGEPPSHLEQSEPEYLKIDDLKVPHKYKDAVKERLKKVASDFEGKVQAAEKQFGEQSEATRAMLGVLKEVAENPAKLAEYVTEYGEKVGIDKSIIEKYAKIKNGGLTRKQDQGAQVPAARLGVDDVLNKYDEKLLSTEDPKEFLSTLKMRDKEMVEVVRNEMVDTFKQLLGGYHEQVVNPNLATLEQARAQAEHQSKVGLWNEAADSVKGKYADFEKYEPKVRELLSSDPMFLGYRQALNADPRSLSEIGVTHEKLVDYAYQLVSRADHIQSANAPKPKFSGLEPNPKHITTQKSGGDDWDDIGREIWGIT